MDLFRLVVGLSLVGILLVFSLQNLEVIQVDFLFWSFSARRIVVLFIVFGGGVVAGWILRKRPAPKYDEHADNAAREL